MDDSPLERLVNQTRANDVDAKVDAITKLQAEFEAGVEIIDFDGVLTALKTCLRISNQHLTTATLSALPPFIPLVLNRSGFAGSTSTNPAASTSSTSGSTIDIFALRQVLNAFVSSGGVIDRLGDSRERSREKARETLVLLGGYAFRSGGVASGSKMSQGKGAEPPMAIFERHLRESGFASKVWRVREQSLLTLVDIRRAHHLFPIRSFLPALVAALEDSDSTVRECAKQSVVELFTGPGVTDAARADLKKELTKKGVRKSIVDMVLSRVLAGASSSSTVGGSGSADNDVSTGSRSGGAASMSKRPVSTVGTNGMSKSTSQVSVKEPSRPPSRAVASPIPTDDGTGPATSIGWNSADLKPIYIASGRDLENEFASMLKPFEGKETEHNWSLREQAILRVRGMLKGDVYERYADIIIQNLKSFLEASFKTQVYVRL